MPFAAPVQYGFPSLQPCSDLDSGLGASGRSSASGAACLHPLQRPASERVRNSTDPDPRQCKPTRSKLVGADTASVRSPRSGTSRTVIDTPADAVAGATRSANKAARTGFMAAATRDRVPARAFCLKVSGPSLIESLRVEERLFAGTFTPR